MPFYAVARGYKPGIYNNWDTCKNHISGFSGAIFKKFSTVDEAKQFMAKNQSDISFHDDKKLTLNTSAKKIDNLNIGYKSKISTNYDVDQKKIRKNMPTLPFDIPRMPLREFYKMSPRNITISNDDKVVSIYVDGACRGNGKMKCPASGYGVFYGVNDERNAAVALDAVDDVIQTRPTNQRAELFAIKHALLDIASDLHSNKRFDIRYIIYSDSQYAQKCFTEWASSWIKNSWKNSQGKPVANRDIISSALPILNYINTCYSDASKPPLEFRHVRGHRGDFGNEYADKLANIGADNMSLYKSE